MLLLWRLLHGEGNPKLFKSIPLFSSCASYSFSFSSHDENEVESCGQGVSLDSLIGRASERKSDDLGSIPSRDTDFLLRLTLTACGRL